MPSFNDRCKKCGHYFRGGVTKKEGHFCYSSKKKPCKECACEDFQ